MQKDKIHAMIHSKESVGAMVDDYDHLSLYKDGEEIVRFYIKDLLAIKEIISHFVKPHSEKVRQLRDTFYSG